MKLYFNIGYGIENEIAVRYTSDHKVSRDLQTFYEKDTAWTAYYSHYTINLKEESIKYIKL